MTCALAEHRACEPRPGAMARPVRIEPRSRLGHILLNANRDGLRDLSGPPLNTA